MKLEDINIRDPFVLNDGGHGMIFKAEDKLYLSYHTPNTNGLEHPKFTLIKDNGKSIELV